MILIDDCHENYDAKVKDGINKAMMRSILIVLQIDKQFRE